MNHFKLYSLERIKSEYVEFSFKNKLYIIEKNGASNDKKNFFSLELTAEEIRNKKFLASLNQSIKSFGIRKLHLRLNPIVRSEDINPLRKILNKDNFRVSDINVILLDLKEKKELLRQKLRKSYKSLINKESKKLSVKFSNNKEYLAIVFNDWINIYSAALKRGNSFISPKASELLLKSISNEKSLIAIAYDDLGVAGGALFSIENELSIYQSAANTNKIEIDKKRGVGHFIIWNSIIKLKEMGVKYLELGTFYDVEPKTNYLKKWIEKEHKINKFKKGFGGKIANTLYFEKDFNNS